MTDPAKIELLALDVDGVLTDGGLYYGPEGVVQRFSSADGAALIRLRATGLPVVLISFRDYPATRRRAADLGIKLLYLGTEHKKEALLEVCSHLGITSDRSLFMGDGLMDLPALLIAGISACPSDAHPEVRAACDVITANPGGHGAVKEIVELLLRSREDG